MRVHRREYTYNHICAFPVKSKKIKIKLCLPFERGYEINIKLLKRGRYIYKNDDHRCRNYYIKRGGRAVRAQGCRVTVITG